MSIRPLLPFGIASLSTAFLGITWNATPEQVRRSMLDRKGVVAEDSISDTTLGFYGGSYAGIESPHYQFSFTDGHFTQVIVYFLHDELTDARRAYTRLRRYLTSRYGILEPERSTSSDDIACHHCTAVSGRIGTALSRLETQYLVAVVFNGLAGRARVDRS